MEVEKILSFIKQLDFEDVIRQESREYLNEGYKYMPYSEKDDDKKFITNGLKRFINKDDKVVFLLESINHLNEAIAYITTRLDYFGIKDGEEKKVSVKDYEYSHTVSELIKKIKSYKARVFYAVRELEKLGFNNLNKNAFTKDESQDLSRKINALLIKIDELTVGQEVIFNHIDDLKTNFNELKGDFPLGKKRWYQRFSGIVASYLGNKGADVLYEALKPDLMSIIHESGIGKLLK